MSLPSPSDAKSPLLADEAVRAGAEEMTQWSGPVPGGVPGFMPYAERLLRAVARYHATEGREALVQEVRRALSFVDGTVEPWADHHYREQAEAAVTALFGKAE